MSHHPPRFVPPQPATSHQGPTPALPSRSGNDVDDGDEMTGVPAGSAGTSGGDVAALAGLLTDGVPRWDAATVLAGAELTWFELMERVRSSGPDPVFAPMDDAQLVAELGRRAAGLAASTCRYLELVAELAVRGIWADQGARTPGQWLSFQLGLGASTAADHLRVGLRLRELPAIRERFAAGRISYSKVRAITRIAVPETEELLLRWSQWATGAEVERIVRAFRSTCHGAEDERLPDRQRDFRTRRNGDGTTTITVRVPDDEAAAIEASLDRLLDLDDNARPDDPSSAEDGSSLGEVLHEPSAPSPDASPDDEWDDADAPGQVSSAEDGRPQALGLAGLLALDAAGAGTEIPLGPDVRWKGGAGGRGGADPADQELPPLLTEQRTRGARRADALVDACVAAAAGGGTDTSGLDRHTLVLHADVADLQQPQTHTVPVDTPNGRTRSMSPRVLRRLACEAGVVLVPTDGRTPIDVGRRQQRPTTAQRRALTVRDRSCRFPGCGAMRHLHAHHVVHWADDGPTDLANLVLICGFHHRFVHEHGWRVTPAAAGTFRFAPPDGSWVPTAGQLPGADASGRSDVVPIEPNDRSLRPTAHSGRGNLDLHTAVLVLHQELRALTGSDALERVS
jgi:hypothetical protein